MGSTPAWWLAGPEQRLSTALPSSGDVIVGAAAGSRNPPPQLVEKVEQDRHVNGAAGAGLGFGRSENHEAFAIGREVHVDGAGVEQGPVAPEPRLTGNKRAAF